MAFQFRHFQTRLLALLLIPLLLILSAIYYAVSTAYTENAYNIITRDLELSLTNFIKALDDRNEILAIAGDALSDDYGFKQAYNLEDVPSVVSAMDNLLSRLYQADFMAFTGEKSGKIVASTFPSQLPGATPDWASLITEARQLDRQGKYPEATDAMIINNHPFQVTVLPFLTPDLNNWVTLGFEIGEEITSRFHETFSVEVTVLFKVEDNWHINASTLPDNTHSELLLAFNAMMDGDLENILNLAGEDYVTLAESISTSTNTVEVLLQRSLASELKPFNELQVLLFQIVAIGVILAMMGIILISRTVTRPVTALAKGAKHIAAGDYEQRVSLPQQDELGQLASSFNNMAEGLAEKEKVRDLLGKVVSPEIATELMSRELELGGEEREVTILFSDLRGFTTLCEGKSPKQILSLLNEYFSAVTAVIESHGGVVDKYIGDAVMALFGAPMLYPDAPARAVKAALGMSDALTALNLSFRSRGLPDITIGIGINTDQVVVGNMGSQTRLNYTAIGDGVNLASRLEGLNKNYGTQVIVSAASKKQAEAFLYLELDQVRVVGKQEPVRIFTPLSKLSEASAEQVKAVSDFSEFLAEWYAGNFGIADEKLAVLEAARFILPSVLSFYRHRLLHFGNQPPADWDGASTITEK